MRSAIFSFLVWASSNGLIGIRAVALSNSAHMLRTLRGWALATFVICIAMRFFVPSRGAAHREAPFGDESAGRQVRLALLAFLLFSIGLTMLTGASFAGHIPLTPTRLALLGGVLAPVTALIALEFPACRPPVLATGAFAAVALPSLMFVNMAVRPSTRPTIRRTHPMPADQILPQPARPAIRERG